MFLSRFNCVLSIAIILLSAGSVYSQLPAIDTFDSNNPAPGNFFIADFSYAFKNPGSYLLRLDNDGRILFHQSSTSSLGSMDFRPWPGGRYTYYDEKNQKYYVLNSTFQPIDSFPTNDDHEFRFLANGDAIFL